MIRGMLAAVRRARFAVWVAQLRARLRRHGMKLIVEAPQGVRLRGLPPVEIVPHGHGGTTTLRFGADLTLGAGPTFEIWTGTTNRFDCGDAVCLMVGAHVQLRGGTIALGRNTTVRAGAVLKATDGELVLGERVLVSWHVVVACSQRIEIGDCVALSERVSVIDSDHGVDGSDTPWQDQPLRTTPVRLSHNVLVSANAAILRGTTIGPNALIGANAVVRAGDYPGGWLLAGIPAEPIRALPATVQVPPELQIAESALAPSVA